jgi:hypothetical protein
MMNTVPENAGQPTGRPARRPSPAHPSVTRPIHPSPREIAWHSTPAPYIVHRRPHTSRAGRGPGATDTSDLREPAVAGAAHRLRVRERAATSMSSTHASSWMTVESIIRW